MTESAKLLGAIIAVVDNLLVTALLWARVLGWRGVEHWLGLILIASTVPLAYLLTSALGNGRSVIYAAWLGLMILYLLVELVLDYILKFDFRQTRWMVIVYVTLFFGATGGMIGVASRAGRLWAILAVASWIVMAGTAFYQRWKTGM
ncbi:MAG TPA: hypothetical protein VM118_03440 [Acidobacteriota bacterium]|nr:hypothetical protein [Acidobacteriota bacterium]